MEINSILMISLQMDQKTTLGQRLKSIREKAGLSARKFAVSIGIDPSQYSKTEKDQLGLPINALAEVASTYDVDLNWLIAGRTPSLQESKTLLAHLQQIKTRPKKRIPLFDESADASNVDADTMPITEPVGYISTGDLFGTTCEAALCTFGNSMSPGYPPGTILGLARHYDSFIQPGELYVLETRSQLIFKRLFDSEGDPKDCYECYSDNNATFTEGPRKGKPFYPAFYVPKKEILRMWAVIGSAREHVNSLIIHTTP